jgi:hypothetical protein
MTARRAAARRWRPFAARLSDELAELLNLLDELLDGSAIVNVDPNDDDDSPFFYVGFPNWGWKADGDVQTQRRLELIATWVRWRQLFDLLFADPPPDVAERIDEGARLVDDWIRRPGGDHSIPASIPEAKARLRERTTDLLELLAMKAASGAGVIAIPDTNALILSPAVEAYGSALGTDEYEVHLVPTVVSELDRLKVEGRTPELRDKVHAVLRRIKGLRDRGTLADGVTVTRTVRLLSQAREPDFARMPGWLDPANNDDRILAAALEIQGRRSAATVVLVSGDLNLQTKADAAGMPYVEPPTAS